MLSIADATAVIEGGSASFVVSMGASEKQVTVSYETEDGTAAEPGDYTSTSGTLTFEAGATTKTVTVVTANDTVDEADGETFTVKLSNPVNATLATGRDDWRRGRSPTTTIRRSCRSEMPRQ